MKKHPPLENTSDYPRASKYKHSFASLQRGYWMVPRIATKSRLLTAFDCLVFGMIVSLTIGQELYKEGVEPSQIYIAQETGAGERTIRDALRKLEKYKLIETVRRGQGKTNIYKLSDEGVKQLDSACE